MSGVNTFHEKNVAVVQAVPRTYANIRNCFSWCLAWGIDGWMVSSKALSVLLLRGNLRHRLISHRAQNFGKFFEALSRLAFEDVTVMARKRVRVILCENCCFLLFVGGGVAPWSGDRTLRACFYCRFTWLGLMLWSCGVMVGRVCAP